MKFSTTMIIASLMATASAFAPSTKSTTNTALNVKSKALPFMEAPAILDGTYAGDAGFDPLGLARNEVALESYREAEIKHARLAMLAAAGWPISELLDRKIATALGMEPVVDATERAPSILNGGLERVPFMYWTAVLAGAALVDLKQFRKSQSNDPDYSFPGDLGWDPLGLYPEDSEGQLRMQTAEIKNGRLAMVAITAFAVQEYLQKFAVVDATPMFFKPANELAAEYGSSLGAEIVSQNVNSL